MGKQSTHITDTHQSFIESQHVFFVATAAPEGRVNLSPKGLDSLRVLGPNRVVWLNLTGSGNETAAHLLESPRMTLMFCAFEGKPNILRLYGTAKAVHPSDPEWDELTGSFGGLPGARQVIDLAVDLVQTSCGFAVPEYTYVGQRQTLIDWAERKGPEGVARYQAENNTLSLDGKPTGIGGPEGS